jgi:hypothetical protein
MSPRAFAASVLALALVVVSGIAHAHGLGMSTLQLQLDGTRLHGDWTLNLRDAARAIGRDPALEKDAAWDDLRAHEPELRALLLRSLSVRGDSLPGRVALDPSPMTRDPKFDDVVFRVEVVFPVEPQQLTLESDLLFDLDPNHRGYFSVQDSRAFNAGVLRAHERSATFRVRQYHFGETVHGFVGEGVHHIWGGLDHLLFLLALLLPAGLVRTGGEWRPRPGFRAALGEVLKVVTAFTAAHSITLALGYFGVVRLPEAVIEAGIAVSVFLAAWNNLRPFLPGRAWTMAFGFGLVHGLGFAGALANLSLPRQGRGVALASFNVGVELGQIAIVLAILPLLYLASRRSWYPRLVMGVGSLVIAFVAVVWFLERGFGMKFFSGH